MAHPKHHKNHGEPKSKGPSPAKFAWAVATIGALIMGAIWWVASTPVPNIPNGSCCKPDPAPAVENPSYNHILAAQAWCDHAPVWKEAPERRHVVVSARPEVIIQAVEVHHNNKLVVASIRLGDHPEGADWSSMILQGAFKEGMHGEDLAVTVTYIVKGVKFQTILHCKITVTH